MKTYMRVLSDGDRDRVHESTIKILSETGVRVETALGRDYLKKAGAKVDENTRIVRIPRKLLEESIQAAPKKFSLGARRPGWDLGMNEGNCSLLIDGGAIEVIDHRTRQKRPPVSSDWFDATRVIDAIDEFGAYWGMVYRSDVEDSLPNTIKHWIQIFKNFSKHVQDGSSTFSESAWLLEILQTVFGDKETIKKTNPFSFLVCPLSPLIIEGEETDAYLATRGYQIPIAVMPMPLMGGTGPGNMISMTILGNCEVLAMLCLVQVADPGTPFIYAPATGVMNPRTGMYSAGAIENALLSSAATEMSRYYGLAALGGGGGTDTYVPGIQAGYERAMSSVIGTLSWPDLLVGPGLLGGSMILSLEQLVIDVEMFRMSKQAYRGIPTHDEAWLDEIIQKVAPGGHFMGEKSTIKNMRSGEWLMPSLGVHDTEGSWVRSGRKDILDEAREQVDQILKTHKPLPLDDDVQKELDKIYKKAQEVAG
ncbi:MAG: trimethylamine methyltransferase family protein [Anaerolineales bacterium]